MNSTERVKSILKERNIPVSKVEQDCNFSNGYLSSLKKDLPCDRLFIIADYLNIDARWIVTGEVSAPFSSSIEQDFIKKYRDLDDHGKETVLYTLNNEYERMRQIEEIRINRPKLKVLPRSIQPASAGTGVLLDSESMENIIVVETSKTKQASFIVRVSGDSMEPEYHDGDQLLVDATQEPPIGKIGVFIVDGCGYVKKRGANSLISLNKDYADIPYNDSIRCSGSVIGKMDQNLVY